MRWNVLQLLFIICLLSINVFPIVSGGETGFPKDPVTPDPIGGQNYTPIKNSSLQGLIDEKYQQNGSYIAKFINLFSLNDTLVYSSFLSNNCLDNTSNFGGLNKRSLSGIAYTMHLTTYYLQNYVGFTYGTSNGTYFPPGRYQIIAEGNYNDIYLGFGDWRIASKLAYQNYGDNLGMWVRYGSETKPVSQLVNYSNVLEFYHKGGSISIENHDGALYDNAGDLYYTLSELQELPTPHFQAVSKGHDPAIMGNPYNVWFDVSNPNNAYNPAEGDFFETIVGDGGYNESYSTINESWSANIPNNDSHTFNPKQKNFDH